jgi:hypothetical protein
MKGEIKMDTDFLDMYTDEMLENVLKERKEQKKIQDTPPRPEPKYTKAGFRKIADAAHDMLDEMEGDDYCIDNDNESSLYETVMSAIYGEEIWAWMNAQTDD